MFPRNSVVFGAVKSTSSATAGKKPRLPARLPKRPKDNVGIVRVKDNIDSARVFVFRQNFRPCLAPIACAKNSALLIRAEGVAQCRHQHNVWILRMNDERADLPAIFQSDIRSEEHTSELQSPMYL